MGRDAGGWERVQEDGTGCRRMGRVQEDGKDAGGWEGVQEERAG
jgi:hypothetical protein